MQSVEKLRELDLGREIRVVDGHPMQREDKERSVLRQCGCEPADGVVERTANLDELLPREAGGRGARKRMRVVERVPEVLACGVCF